MSTGFLRFGLSSNFAASSLLDVSQPAGREDLMNEVLSASGYNYRIYTLKQLASTLSGGGKDQVEAKIAFLEGGKQAVYDEFESNWDLLHSGGTSHNPNDFLSKREQIAAVTSLSIGKARTTLNFADSLFPSETIETAIAVSPNNLQDKAELKALRKAERIGKRENKRARRQK